MFKRNTRSKKEQLKHLNDVYPIFKKYCKNKNIDPSAQDETIKILLREYLQNKNFLIDENTINKAKDMNEL